MNTIKSAAVVLVLAGVLYGVYTVLNKPEPGPPPGMTSQQVNQMGPPQVEMSLSSPAAGLPAPPTSLTGPSEGVSPADLTPVATADYPAPESPLAASGNNRRSSYEAPATDAPVQLDGSSAPPLEIAPPTDTPAPAAEPVHSSVNAFSFRRDLQAAEQHVADGKFRSALATLSPYYHLPDLTPDERQQLMAWLDPLAAKVIYSREHLLDSPYQVRSKGEMLYQIAEKYHVPWQLLANINGVSDPDVLVLGTELKVVPGPFRADVNLTTGELTVFLGELYAGRFPFALGNEPPQPGEYSVLDKRPDRTYYGPDGRTIAANDRSNPYGERWLDLGAKPASTAAPPRPAARRSAASACAAGRQGCVRHSRPQLARRHPAVNESGSRPALNRPQDEQQHDAAGDG